MMYVLIFTPSFAKNYQKLPQVIKQKAEHKEKLFRENPFSPSLKTHKLSGKLNIYWSFSIDYHYRIVFRFTNKDEILLVDVGTHSVYK